MKKLISTESYLKSFPGETQKMLKQMRAIIKKAAPGAEEVISYGMPAVKINGENLVYFAGMKSHFGFYPTSSGVKAFETELKKYRISFSKGCIRFPYGKPLPTGLITKIIKFRAKESLAKAKAKKK